MTAEEKLKELLGKGKVAVEYNKVTEELRKEAMKPQAMPEVKRPNS